VTNTIATVRARRRDRRRRQRRSTNLALLVNSRLDLWGSDRKLERVTESFSTLDVAPRERVDFWRQMIRRHFVPLGIEPLADRDFDGTVRLRSIGELDVARVRADPMLACRTREHIERSGGDEYFIGLHLHGIAEAEQDGRAVSLAPGDFALFDSARPYQIAFRAAGTFDHLILRIPREQLEWRAAHLERATACTVKVGSAGGRLAAPMLRSLVSLDMAAPLVDPALDLIAAAIIQAAGLAGTPASRRQRTLEEIRRYTLAHLARSDLSPASVAQACFVSPRQIHRLFEQQGTSFGRFVKEARLRRIHRELADPALANLTIAEIGWRNGYRSAPVLTRAFTKRYGSGPRAFRQTQCDNAWRPNGA
jgi:AraC-like DNA-binding protein